MKKIIELDSEAAKAHFLKGSSYFNGDFPSYINFSKMLKSTSDVLNGASYTGFKSGSPADLSGVNYSFVANKDGRLAWRPLELIHPAIYVSLVNLVCEKSNWDAICQRFYAFNNNVVECCSVPMFSDDAQTDKAVQVESWWKTVEQRSLTLSLEFSHLLQTDVTDCYGSLYTHSISWALHGFDFAKAHKKDKITGNLIDAHIQAGRYGQTNGIPQGSVVADFLAELLLGYVDELVTIEIGKPDDVRILRYRDDYRIFTNSDTRAEIVLKIISDKLRSVGMKLSTAKTSIVTNVIEGAVKPDKLAGIDLYDLGIANAKTLQKQLLRLHSFGRRFPNSGALRRLVGDFHTKIAEQSLEPEDLEVQVAIATDIGFISPQAFPGIAAILSHLISLAPKDRKAPLWEAVMKKMSRVPHNGYLEVWMQRVIKPKGLAIEFNSDEPICKIVNGIEHQLWDNSWIESKAVLEAIKVSSLIISDPAEVSEAVAPDEIELFKQIAWSY